MKMICKVDSPAEFEYWKNVDRTWRAFTRNARIKNLVKQNLLSEQGYICCYCGDRIEFDGCTSIEHFKPKGLPEFQHLTLDYNNLFASCDGGKGERCEQGVNDEEKLFPLSCDPKKGNNVIPVSPLDETFESLIQYNADGTITSIDQNGIGDIMISELGLDNPELINRRCAAIDVFIDSLPEDLDIPFWLNYLDSKEDDKFYPFCFAVKQVLELINQ